MLPARRCEVADELGVGSIAFPAVSAGIYGWPMADAADVALRTVAADADRRHRRPVRAVQRRGRRAVPPGPRRARPGDRVDRPPEEIELPAVGAVLRRHRLDDLDALHRAIEESRDHLRPFMPFADQSRLDTAGVPRARHQPVDGRHELQLPHRRRRWRRAGDVLGGCGIHHRLGPDATEIGYWLRATATGRGIVTAAAAALTDAGLALDGIERVEIHCDEANTRSAAVARRLGYRLDRIEPEPGHGAGRARTVMIWVSSRRG